MLHLRFIYASATLQQRFYSGAAGWCLVLKKPYSLGDIPIMALHRKAIILK